MFVIGIVGGVASGKSAVTRQFERLGATIVDADQLGHAVLDEPEVQEALEARWGDSIFVAEAGARRVDRRRVAQIVFGTRESAGRERHGATAADELAFLERITHPRIGQWIDRRLAEIRRCGADGVVVLDAPVMLKAGWDRFCDRILYVDAPEAVRQQRAAARGWTPEMFQSREAAQTPVAEKKSRADGVIDNSGSLADLRQQVRDIWDSVRKSADGNHLEHT